MKRLALLAVGALLVGCAPKYEMPETAVNPQSPTPAAPAPTASPTTDNPAPLAVPAPATVPAAVPTPAPATVPAPVAVPNPAAIPDTSPSVGPPPSPATVPAVVAPPHAKDVPIFETVKDAKTYVFTSIGAMNAFTTSGTQRPIVSEKPNFAGSGTTVVIEAADEVQAEQMVASYTKLHPPVVK